MKTRLIFTLVIFMGIFFLSAVQAAEGESYQFSWPGILPDNPLYKLKVLRNKIIPRLIISPVKRVEFDLLMADKTLYASKLLLDKGKPELSQETALKGENYFSILVSDYAFVLAQKKTIPLFLQGKIVGSYRGHQQLISYLIQHATEKDKETYEKVEYFSRLNYQTLVKLQQNNRK